MELFKILTFVTFITWELAAVQAFIYFSNNPRVPLDGDKCNGTVTCKEDSHLQCVSGTCQCPHPELVQFDRNLEKCIIKVGSKCVIPKVYSFALKSHLCSPNSSCSFNHKCECNPGFYETPEKTCSPLKEHGVSCRENVECNKSKRLHCHDRKRSCECNSTTSVYDRERDLCVGLPGEECINGQCAGNGICFHDMSHNKWDLFGGPAGKCLPVVGVHGTCQMDQQCIQDKGLILRCMNGTCNCDPSYSVYDSTRNKCVHLYGMDCNAEYECKEGFVCKNHQCLCQFKSQEYDMIRGVCYERVGGPCNHDNGCSLNAHCEKIRGSRAGHCECDSGFVPDEHDLCMKVVQAGGSCNMTSDCDYMAGLECMDGTCHCKDFALFDRVRRRCLGKVGAYCSTMEGDSKKGENQCVDHAECKKVHPKRPPRCDCEVGYRETAEYTCSFY